MAEHGFKMVGFNALQMDEFDEIFRMDSSGRFLEDTRSKLLRKFWSEDESKDPISPSNRCICWRYLLGILSPHNVNKWVEELNCSVVQYTNFKKEIFPSISNVGFDPLSENNPDTVSYFESVEKVKAIELDLNRLYMNGIDEEYFHTKRRNSILQSVLLIWSVQNPSISYRQGIVGHRKLTTSFLMSEWWATI
jgi:Rab-GTPase-TBC domain